MDDYGNFNSDCDKTMVGIVHNTKESGVMDKHPATCFFAVKTESDKSEEKKRVENKQLSKTLAEIPKKHEATDAELGWEEVFVQIPDN